MAFKEIDSGIKLKKFDNQLAPVFEVSPPLMSSSFIMALIASPGGGKTTFILNLLMNKQLYCGAFDQIFVVSKTFYQDSKWEKIKIEYGGIFTEYSEDILEYILGKCSKKTNSLLVLDDMLAEPIFRLRREARANALWYNHRHYNLSIILTSQKFNSLPTTLRENLDVLVIFQLSNRRSIGQIHSEFANELSYETFLKLYKYCTKAKGGTLIIDIHNEEDRYYHNLNKIEFE